MKNALPGLLSVFLTAACASHPAAPESKAAATTPVVAGTVSTQPAPEPVPPPARPLLTPQPLDTVLLSSPTSPLVTFRFVFRAGSVDDPPGKEGLTALTANLLGQGGTRELTSAQLLEALFPMAAELGQQPDKELTTFTGRVHRDHLNRFLTIFLDVLTQPRLDAKEFERLRADAVNNIKNALRGENDEELGKVGLDALLFHGHPYGHYVGGTVAGLNAITLEDVKAQWKRVFTQDRLMLGLAGPVDDGLVQQVKQRLAVLPAHGAPAVLLPVTPDVAGHVLILQKAARSTAISIGAAYGVRRGDPDFVPLTLALSYLGQHREFTGVLYNQLREARGLNYGDYAYAEHFEQSGGGTFPEPNIARSVQDFSVWIRPVEEANALFATRGALYYFDGLLKDGIPADRFDDSRGFLGGYSRQLDQTDARRLGYALDAKLYGTPDFLNAFRTRLATLTAEEVHAAVLRHLRPERLNFVYVTHNAAKLRGLLETQPASPITYPSAKPQEITQVDKSIEVFKLPLQAGQTEIKEAQGFMESESSQGALHQGE